MQFNIKNIDVITHRQKPQTQCVEDWKNYDQYIMDHIMIENKCHPPHWMPTSKLPVCSNITQMKNFIFQPSTAKMDEYGPPCRVIERIDYTYQEKEEKEDIIGR